MSTLFRGECAFEEPTGGSRRLGTPSSDEVALSGLCDQRFERWLEHCDLRFEQRRRGETSALAERQLQQQLGADVAEVGNGLVEPRGGRAPTPGGRCKHASLAALAGLDTGACDQLSVDQRLDRAVGERPTERPDPAEVAAGSEQRTDRPPVRDAFDDESETGLFSERRRSIAPACGGHGVMVVTRACGPGLKK